jgi:hypothetical protein
MQINRSNYEIWLTDWLDGKLNEIQVGEICHFLSRNPDLKEEFDELASFMLNPSKKSFPDKNQLKRTPADLSETQFEFLSVACLEDDLSADEQNEFMESIRHNQAKKQSFELIQKMKLSPSDLKYKHKNRLMRETVVWNVIRLSFIGLSAAAVIIFAVITFFSKPTVLRHKTEKIVLNNPPDIILNKPSAKIIAGKTRPEKNIVHSNRLINILADASGTKRLRTTEPDTNQTLNKDSLFRSAYSLPAIINMSPSLIVTVLNIEPVSSNLVACKSIVQYPEYDDERPWLGKFLSKTFRAKIMKEKTATDDPVKIYEIAEASVNGLNKLLGWQMTLDERKDQNGELKSVYFSSKILKFNAPVKKSELLP